MTENEYHSKMKVLEKEFSDAKSKLYVEYVMSNKKANVGDFVTDGRGIILVDKITTSKTLGLPYATYHGVLHTTKMVPFKSGERGFACEGDRLIIVKRGEQHQ